VYQEVCCVRAAFETILHQPESAVFVCPTWASRRAKNRAAYSPEGGTASVKPTRPCAPVPHGRDGAERRSELDDLSMSALKVLGRLGRRLAQTPPASQRSTCAVTIDGPTVRVDFFRRQGYAARQLGDHSAFHA